MIADANDPRLDDLLLRWEELHDQGQSLSADELCSTCPELAGELARRITYLRKMDPLLDEATTAPGNPASAAPAGGSSRVSATARADFHNLRFHAAGALGEVFMARNAELNRDVALKFLKPGRSGDPDSLRRFLQEAEVTGRLEHPGVVPIYALGTDGSGAPCYAMRFIRGETLQDPIDAFHAAEKSARDPSERSLALRDLLNRFVSICGTMAYAHSRGILHRDLKPRNVMLGKYDETLVLDWGLAKPFDRDEAARSVGEETLMPSSGLGGGSDTPTVGVVGTLAYMSPEQAEANGKIVGPASDIFGLGAILYAILAGRPPYQGRTMAEILEKVKRCDFAAPRQIKPGVSRALEAVCLKAMAPQPEDRYATATELATDIRRWLADEPVSAYSELWTTRIARWGQRHRTLVTGAVASVSVAAVALGVSTALLGRANEQIRSREQTARENLYASRRFVAGMFEKVVKKLPDVKGMDNIQQAILEDGLKFYAEFVLERSRDPDTRHQVGKAYQDVGLIQLRLGQPSAAETAFRKGLEVLGSLTAEYPAVPEYGSSLAGVLTNLGSFYRESNRPNEGEALFRRALAIREELAGASIASAQTRQALARGHYSLALFYDHYSRFEEAERSYRMALSIQEKLVADTPEHALYRSDLGQTLYELGYLLDSKKGKLMEALPMYERLVTVQEELLRESPISAQFQSDLTGSLSYLAAMYGRIGRMHEAEKAHMRSIAIQKALADDHPEIAVYQLNLGKSYANLGNHWRRAARPDQAEQWHQEALRIMDKASRANPDQIDYAVSAALAPGNIGKDRADEERHTEALGWYDRSLSSLEAIYKASPRHATTTQHLSTILVARAESAHALGRDVEALSDLRRAADLDRSGSKDQIRSLRARAQARALDPSAAAAAAAAMEVSTEGEVLYNTAATYALLSAAERGSQGPHASRAVTLLSRARVNGYFAIPADLARLSHDHDFDSLRQRPDFRSFVADLTFPADPFAK